MQQSPVNHHAYKGNALLNSGAPNSNAYVSPSRSPSQMKNVSELDSTQAEGSYARDPLQRTASTTSTKVDPTLTTPSRSLTLRKKTSVRKRLSLNRRGSIPSLRAASFRELGAGDDNEFNNVFNVPIPTNGNPTEILADRFQAWRKLLKDLTTYFGEIQSSYEHRSKALLKVSNVINNTTKPPVFMSEGGLDEATGILRKFHKQAIAEANKAKDIEEDVITQLNGLRSDLNQKIKEIKSLSGDFKNSVDKEKESTRKAVDSLRDALLIAESDHSGGSGKNDPYIIRLNVDRQVEKQIEEENYLHRAYLNLEGSGRELESIVVGEIQKAYNAYVGILRRETEHAHEAMDELRAGPIAMPKDLEWTNFVQGDSHFIDPALPLRKVDNISYPGKSEPAAQEIKAGTLERKSKYLKSYTAGWYVLSATHLHEFKSPDHIHTQSPVMSLQLSDQRLGSHSQPGATSHKFSLKGRQTGAIHRGHSWVFRAESYDTMMAWYDDIRSLTEKTTVERNAFIKRHARNLSSGNHTAPSISSDGLAEDEADRIPYTANSTIPGNAVDGPTRRSEPGGRFLTDLNHDSRLPPTLARSSGSSDNTRNPVTVAQAQRNSLSPSPPRTGVLHIPKSRKGPSAYETVSTSQTGNLEALDQNDFPKNNISNKPTTSSIPVQNPTPVNHAIQNQITSVSASSSAVPVAAVSSAPAQPIEPKPIIVEQDIQKVEEPRNEQEREGEAGIIEANSVDITPTGVKSRDDYFSSSPSALQRRDSGDQLSASSLSTPTKASVPDAAPMHANNLKSDTAQQPSVLMRESTASASELHVPGEFPPTPASN